MKAEARSYLIIDPIPVSNSNFAPSNYVEDTYDVSRTDLIQMNIALFTGCASPFNDIGGLASSFQRLSSGGDRGFRNFLRENAEGAGMPPLLSH
jgi:hypothetical protein